MFLLIGWLEKRMRKPDHEEKQQPYFRYPQPDPYYGFFDNREKQMDIMSRHSKSVLRSRQETAVETNPHYWDCECENDYIRPKQSLGADQSKFECHICGASEDTQPDSRVNEVTAAKADVEMWPSIETRKYYQIHGWVSMDTKIDVLASSEEEAIKVAERVFEWRVDNMYNAAFGASEYVYHDWYSPSCDQMDIVDVREYGGETCYTLESTAEEHDE